MKITDGKKTVEIRIQYWTGSGYGPDCSKGYFGAGTLPYNEETDILSFSPNGDYIRVNTDETANGEKKKEQ